MSTQLPPYFFLYGEAEQTADPDFVHIEDLATRSQPSGWSISPHKHADLNHLILISKGGGTIQYESDFSEFIAPALLVVPAEAIHGFEWHEDSGGQVLTIANVQLQQLCTDYGEFTKLFETARCIDLEPEESAAIDASMGLIARESSWIGLGQSAALQAGLLMVLVEAARRLQHVEGAVIGSTRQRNIVARYRQLIEKRYRLREPVDVYARELGVSQTALREACATMGQSPVAMRDQRAILEAQRLLAFSALSISEVGEAVGIADPAYFSRFFARKCGLSPAQWRRDAVARREST